MRRKPPNYEENNPDLQPPETLILAPGEPGGVLLTHRTVRQHIPVLEATELEVICCGGDRKLVPPLTSTLATQIYGLLPSLDTTSTEDLKLAGVSI